MSHFTTVETKIKDLVCLRTALNDLNYAWSENSQGLTVRGYIDNQDRAEIVVKVSSKYDVGIRISGGQVELVADWWGVETTAGITQEQFVNKLTQRYAYHKVKKEVENRGYKIELDEEVEEQQTISVVVSKWQ